MVAPLAVTLPPEGSVLQLSQLHPLDLFGVMAGTAMLVIAAAQWLASHYTDRRALRLFALRYLLGAAGWFFAHPYAQSHQSRAPFVSMVVGVVLSALTLWALDEFLETATRRRRIGLLALALAVIAALGGYKQIAPADASGIYLVMAASHLLAAAMAWSAAARETNVGHRVVALALLTFPAMVGWSWWHGGTSHMYELGYFVALPSALIGVAVLVVSLIRARQRTEQALAEHARAEQALRDLNATLERRVDERTAELQKLADGLNAFTRNVSHDLRGPLGGILGLAQLAQAALDEGDAERARGLLRPIAPQTERLLALVQDLMTLSRVSEAPLSRVAQPLAPLVGEALAQLARSPEEAQHLKRVKVDVEALPEAAVDASMLANVFVNLIGNAVRFAAAQPGPGHVRVGARQQGDRTEVFVADNGAGFPAEQSEKLFQPFGLLHGGTLSRNGIGLSIVRRVVERHGGRVWAESRPGSGATFWFSLDSR